MMFCYFIVAFFEEQSVTRNDAKATRISSSLSPTSRVHVGRGGNYFTLFRVSIQSFQSFDSIRFKCIISLCKLDSLQKLENWKVIQY